MSNEITVPRTTFLGASISKFNCSLGWGNNPSTFSTTLVEDRVNGDSFNPPMPGQPAAFVLDGWKFEGLVERYRVEGGESGSPIYTVDLVDPREILNGVQLILNGYTGYVNLPNVMNIFGYLENQGFGQSKVNEIGMPWYLIRQAVVSLISTPFNIGGSYGGSISFQGNSYTLDLTELPSIDNHYRIGGHVISLMDFITNMCDISGRSYFFSLENRNIIKLWTVDRNRVPDIGAISNFISNTPGATSKGIGMEMRNETTSKMLLGADYCELYGANPFPNNINYDSIWHYIGVNPTNGSVGIPYWNKDNRDIQNLRQVNNEQSYDRYSDSILGEDLTYSLDTRGLDVRGVGASYTTDLDEMYAVKEGIDSWKSLLGMADGFKYLPDKSGPQVDVVFHIGQRVTGFTTVRVTTDTQLKQQGMLAYKKYLPTETDSSNRTVYIIRRPIYGKKDIIPVLLPAFQRCLSASYCALRFDKFEEALNIYKNTSWQDRGKMEMGVNYNVDELTTPVSQLKLFKGYRHKNRPSPHFLKASYLGIYSIINPKFVAAVAEQKPGGKIPINSLPLDNTAAGDLVFKEDMDAHHQRLYDFLSVYAETVGKTFMVSLPFIQSVYDQELMEVRTNYEITEGGYIPPDRYQASVAQGLVPPNPNGFILNDGRYTPYVRFNKFNTFGQRKLDLSELSEQDYFENERYVFVKARIEQNFVYLNASTGHSARCIVSLPGAVKYGQIRNIMQRFSLAFSGEGGDVDFTQLQQAIGGDSISSPISARCIVPDLIVVPLKNKNRSYGPWYAAGAAGKVEVEKDETLAPWNYLSYQDMNRVGQIKVSSAISTQTFDESGDIEFPGVPSIQLGRQLVSGGPYITNINVNVGKEGVTTRYSMQTWVPRFGERYAQILEKHTKQIEKRMNSQEKALEQLRLIGLGSQYYENRKMSNNRSKTVKSNSSHHIISADENGVVIQPEYNAVNQYASNYRNKAIMSLDGLFSPISCGDSGSTLPNLDLPEELEEGVNAIGLFPFKGVKQHESVVSRGYSVPEDGFGSDNPEATDRHKFVGLKGPQWMAGWGYNSYGEPLTYDIIQDGIGSFSYTSNIEGTRYEYDNGRYIGLPSEYVSGSEEGTGATFNIMIEDNAISHISLNSRGNKYVAGDILTVKINGTPIRILVNTVFDYKVANSDMVTDMSEWKSGPIGLVYDEYTKTWVGGDLVLVETAQDVAMGEVGPCYVLTGPLGMEERVQEGGGYKVIYCYNRYGDLLEGSQGHVGRCNGRLEIIAAGCQ